jgi:type IV secretion system protein VirB9
MKRSLLWIALLMSISSHAVADVVPTPGSKDARMRTVTYDPSQVARVLTAVGSALVVSFSPDESITAVAVSDSKDLMAIPRGNFLFMKAKTSLPAQPVIVLTSGPNGMRRYVFEVETATQAESAADSPDIFYSVEFDYPEDRAAARKAAQRNRRAVEEQGAIARELAGSHDDERGAAGIPHAKGARNFHYVARGNQTLLPVEVYDNGYSTVFRFAGNMRIPAIFRINPDGSEATANYSVKGDSVIVGAVASGWRLRDGNTVLCVLNRAYDKIGSSPGTNTTSSRVERVTEDAPK